MISKGFINLHYLVILNLNVCSSLSCYPTIYIIHQFLAHVTGVLDLPFAARRLFDCQGKELFTIQGLERGSLVIASCGEEWSDPRLTRMEQKRRFLLSQLSSDVVKIRQYCALRNPEGKTYLTIVQTKT